MCKDIEQLTRYPTFNNEHNSEDVYIPFKNQQTYTSDARN